MQQLTNKENINKIIKNEEMNKNIFKKIQVASVFQQGK